MNIRSESLAWIGALGAGAGVHGADWIEERSAYECQETQEGGRLR